MPTYANLKKTFLCTSTGTGLEENRKGEGKAVETKMEKLGERG